MNVASRLFGTHLNLPALPADSMRTSLFAAALAACLLSLPVVAQPFPTLSTGQTVVANLTPDSPRMMYGGPFTVYRISVEAGGRYLAEVPPGDTMVQLMLLREVGGITETINVEAAYEEGTSTRLRIRPEDNASYLLVLQSVPYEEDVASDYAGSFTLTFSEQPMPAPATPIAAQVGGTYLGTISESSAVVDTEYSDEIAHELYVIRASAGDQLIITMDSNDFDSFLDFGPFVRGRVENVTDSDDDSGGELNARLRVHIPEDGEYGIIARSFSTDQYGAYSLTVNRHVPAPMRMAPISSGATIQGTLTEQDGETTRGTFGRHYTFRGNTGDRVRIAFDSDDFDAYLRLGMMRNGVFEELASDDDGGEGLNSLIEFTLPESGEYVIEAAPLWGSAVGAYTLHLTGAQ